MPNKCGSSKVFIAFKYMLTSSGLKPFSIAQKKWGGFAAGGLNVLGLWLEELENVMLETSRTSFDRVTPQSMLETLDLDPSPHPPSGARSVPLRNGSSSISLPQDGLERPLMSAADYMDQEIDSATVALNQQPVFSSQEDETNEPYRKAWSNIQDQFYPLTPYNNSGSSPVEEIIPDWNDFELPSAHPTHSTVAERGGKLPHSRSQKFQSSIGMPSLQPFEQLGSKSPNNGHLVPVYGGPKMTAEDLQLPLDRKRRKMNRQDTTSTAPVSRLSPSRILKEIGKRSLESAYGDYEYDNKDLASHADTQIAETHKREDPIEDPTSYPMGNAGTARALDEQGQPLKKPKLQESNPPQAPSLQKTTSKQGSSSTTNHANGPSWSTQQGWDPQHAYHIEPSLVNLSDTQTFHQTQPFENSPWSAYSGRHGTADGDWSPSMSTSIPPESTPGPLEVIHQSEHEQPSRSTLPPPAPRFTPRELPSRFSTPEVSQHPLTSSQAHSGLNELSRAARVGSGADAKDPLDPLEPRSTLISRHASHNNTSTLTERPNSNSLPSSTIDEILKYLDPDTDLNGLFKHPKLPDISKEDFESMSDGLCDDERFNTVFNRLRDAYRRDSKFMVPLETFQSLSVRETENLSKVTKRTLAEHPNTSKERLTRKKKRNRAQQFASIKQRNASGRGWLPRST
ncbi:MAG: hypothetical protein Q9160_002908 [Pyrenula sp. 1 TL-2023]